MIPELKTLFVIRWTLHILFTQWMVLANERSLFRSKRSPDDYALEDLICVCVVHSMEEEGKFDKILEDSREMDNQLDTSDTAALSTILRSPQSPCHSVELGQFPAIMDVVKLRSAYQMEAKEDYLEEEMPNLSNTLRTQAQTGSALHLTSSRREVPSIDSPKLTSRAHLRRKPSTIGCCVSRICQLVAQPLAHAHVSIAIALTPRHTKQTVIRHYPNCSSRCVGQAEDTGNMRHAAGHEDSERANDADSVHHTHRRGERDKLDVCLPLRSFRLAQQAQRPPHIQAHTNYLDARQRPVSLDHHVSASPNAKTCWTVQLSQSTLQKPPKVKRTAPNSTPISFAMSTSSASHPKLSTLSDLEYTNTSHEKSPAQKIFDIKPADLLRSLIHQQKHGRLRRCRSLPGKNEFHSDAILVARHNCDPAVRHATPQPVHTTRFEGVWDAALSVARFVSARDLGIVQHRQLHSSKDANRHPQRGERGGRYFATADHSTTAVQELQNATIADRSSVSVDVVQLAESSANVDLLATSCFSALPPHPISPPILLAHQRLTFPSFSSGTPPPSSLHAPYALILRPNRCSPPPQPDPRLDSHQHDHLAVQRAETRLHLAVVCVVRHRHQPMAVSRLESVEERNENRKTADERFRSSDELRQASALPASMHSVQLPIQTIQPSSPSAAFIRMSQMSSPLSMSRRLLGHQRKIIHLLSIRHTTTPHSTALTLFTPRQSRQQQRHNRSSSMSASSRQRASIQTPSLQIHTNLSLGVICQTLTSRSRAGKNDQQIRAEHGELSAQKMIKNK
ncbi:hypothetical protein BLNAU_23292 [Blattamonas nauphoetae]|uniref:Uncharacterized protein n=1 Tax=Blattamonas nauphoetae TaxID=2049346 RepID=A0ABQ9WQM1_9EUKA|nr:hypothetical protein BLNAU_23292 [Blattamonas nauphoetae]